MTSTDQGYQTHPWGQPAPGWGNQGTPVAWGPGTPATWGQGSPPAEQSSGGVPLWALAGLAIVGLGAWVLYAHGPDIQRYMKIRSM
jgi:hypothetical protein